MAQRMNFFRMRGAYSTLFAWLYNRTVADRIGVVYDDMLGRFLPEARPESTILDVGCGPGHATRRIALAKPDLRVTGVDLSEHMIARARRDGAGVPNLSFQVGDAMNLPFPDGSFDEVVSTASIKHWPDPARGVREMARVARSGGHVMVLEVDRDADDAAITNFVGRFLRPPGSLPLVRAYFRRFIGGQGSTRSELWRWIEGAGLTEVRGGQETRWPLVWAGGTKI